MRHKRRPPHNDAGADGSLGRDDAGAKSKAPARILAHLTRLRHRLARYLAPDLIWNRDISLENDRLRVENERLQSLLDEQGVQS